ncbi:ferritin-like domain-containing protein [Sorangium sp. So ce381]|uniref:ferritin-like domain-containing protein n=1 Tax=Sorangium sp. So ce381 TaxID=3133307 RepID=UPI003F5B53E1
MASISSSPAQFRIALAHQLTRAILATATLNVAVGGVACGGDVTLERAPGGGGGPASDDESSGTRGGMGGNGGPSSDAVTSIQAGGVEWTEEGTVCVALGPSGQGGQGGVGGAAGEGGTAGEGGIAGQGGIGGSPAGTCPTLDPYSSSAPQPLPGAPAGCWYTTLGEGVLRGGECCYEFTATCGGSGRPFLVGERARTARAERRAASAWGAAARPDVAALAQATRAALAEAWLRDALLEHASVASFARFSLELMAVGAPPDMLADAHEAAGDEVRHAALCFGLASAYAGTALAPAPFAFGGRVEVASDLPELAARAVREGCVGETLAALQASEQLSRAADAAVRSALATIAEDEARHAELAWRFVAWALQTGGEPVRRAVSDAFGAALASPPPAATAPDAEADALAAHGRPDGAALAASHRRAVAEVIAPAMAALLGA